MGPTRPVGGARATRTWEALVRLEHGRRVFHLRERAWAGAEARRQMSRPSAPRSRPRAVPTTSAPRPGGSRTILRPTLGRLAGRPTSPTHRVSRETSRSSLACPGRPEQRRPAGARRSHAVARSHPSGWRSASRPAGEPGAERPRVPSPDAQRTSPGRVCRPSSSAPAQRTGAAPDTRRVRARVEDRPNGISRHDRSDRRLRPGRPPMVDGGGRRPSAGANACRARLRTSATHRTAGMAARGRMVE